MLINTQLPSYKQTFADAGRDPDSRFFDALGSKGPIASAEEAGDDSEFESKTKVQVKLYRYRYSLI